MLIILLTKKKRKKSHHELILVKIIWLLGFDVIDMSEDASQDVEGMDASVGYVLSLLSMEPPNSKFLFLFIALGRGGEMGGANGLGNIKMILQCRSCQVGLTLKHFIGDF